MNNASRTPVIAMLLAAELLIAGIAVYSLRGGHIGSPGFAQFTSSGTGGDFVAKTIAPIAAGRAPNVTIDDPESGVEVTASTDGMVHVKDDTYFGGATIGNHNGYPQVRVTQDLGGVHISRPSYESSWGMFIGFSESRQHIEVQVPADATLVIGHCESAEITGLNHGANVTSQDGHIDLTDVKGTVVAHSDDGHITATRISTDSLNLSSNDGYVEALDLDLTGAAPAVTLHSNSGHIRASGRFPAGGTYNFTTSDGKMYVALEPPSDVTIDATTEDGAIRVDNERQRQFDQGDPANGTLRFGSGASAMHMHTSDGSIYITTNGVH
jgi:hypothetical protein